MGMFDSFVGRCPKCGEIFESQTKRFDCTLATIEPGNSITFIDTDNEVISMEFKSKWSCDCGYVPMIVIRDRKFVGFE